MRDSSRSTPTGLPVRCPRLLPSSMHVDFILPIREQPKSSQAIRQRHCRYSPSIFALIITSTVINFGMPPARHARASKRQKKMHGFSLRCLKCLRPAMAVQKQDDQLHALNHKYYALPSLKLFRKDVRRFISPKMKTHQQWLYSPTAKTHERREIQLAQACLMGFSPSPQCCRRGIAHAISDTSLAVAQVEKISLRPSKLCFNPVT